MGFSWQSLQNWKLLLFRKKVNKMKIIQNIYWQRPCIQSIDLSQPKNNDKYSKNRQKPYGQKTGTLKVDIWKK